ncbi:hypothetical protein [uncultured Friedmanniella sp.]|uniref:hypothetical protein n=1 Tax=uncultured Friedmanniella sp. TaxID=335381 RepID=UPI0035CB1747
MSTPTSQARKFADGLERSLWTVAEAAGATGIVAGYQALPLADIPRGYLPLVLILVAGVLAGIKASVAQRWGNGTAATLPADLEPVPPPAKPVDEPELRDQVPLAEHLDPPANPRDVNDDGRDDENGQFLPRP